MKICLLDNVAVFSCSIFHAAEMCLYLTSFEIYKKNDDEFFVYLYSHLDFRNFTMDFDKISPSLRKRNSGRFSFWA